MPPPPSLAVDPDELEDLAAGEESAGGAQAPPATPGEAPRGVGRPPRTRAEVTSWHRVYLERGAAAAAAAAGLSLPRIYQLFAAHGLETRRPGERRGLAAAAGAAARAERAPRPAPAPAPAAERPAQVGLDKLIHEGESPAPRTQIGALTMPCPNCGVPIEQTIVARPAGSRR
jgi:hypothetical protein